MHILTKSEKINLPIGKYLLHQGHVDEKVTRGQTENSEF